MPDDGPRERLRRTLDAADNDDLRYHLRSTLEHLEIQGERRDADRERGD
ncbi:MAG: hypothetical protein ABEJ44_05675 [Halanaeroarchaeum sp.]